jgi:hypothetical protein
MASSLVVVASVLVVAAWLAVALVSRTAADAAVVVDGDRLWVRAFAGGPPWRWSWPVDLTTVGLVEPVVVSRRRRPPVPALAVWNTQAGYRHLPSHVKRLRHAHPYRTRLRVVVLSLDPDRVDPGWLDALLSVPLDLKACHPHWLRDLAAGSTAAGDDLPGEFARRTLAAKLG